jgi:hypothetical protein
LFPGEKLGGMLGYNLVLEAHFDPKHPEHEKDRTWVGSITIRSALTSRRHTSGADG